MFKTKMVKQIFVKIQFKIFVLRKILMKLVNLPIFASFDPF